PGRRSRRSSACPGRPSTRSTPAAPACADPEGIPPMFERFTDKARTAVIAARAEASEHGDQIRPVYLLHALTAGEGVAARALAGLGVDAGVIERRLDRAAPLRRPPGGEDAEALASIGIDLDEIRRRVEESFGPGALDQA